MTSAIADIITIIGGASGAASTLFQLFDYDVPSHTNVNYNVISPYIGWPSMPGASILAIAYSGNPVDETDGATIGIGSNGAPVSTQPGDTGIDLILEGGTQEGRSWYIGVDGQVCISGLSATYPDGTPFGWAGDSVNNCPQPAFGMGGVQFGETATGDPYEPNCMWLDSTGGDDSITDFASVIVNMFDLKYDSGGVIGSGTGLPDLPAAEDLCNTTYVVWRTDSLATLNFGSGKRNAALGKRALPLNDTRLAPNSPSRVRTSAGPQSPNEKRVMISDRDLPDKSAKYFCDSAFSYGPDYINFYEDIYCDMKDKVYYPLCNSANNAREEECVTFDECDMKLYKVCNHRATLFKEYDQIIGLGGLRNKTTAAVV